MMIGGALVATICPRLGVKVAFTADGASPPFCVCRSTLCPLEPDANGEVSLNDDSGTSADDMEALCGSRFVEGGGAFAASSIAPLGVVITCPTVNGST
mmetsp:Transcript_74608/g.86640  ORF Transcript_74608/g.86640 Transcript_74608/m.86640 type:complete len:98 (-) Transcript_74608:178-471(-)